MIAGNRFPPGFEGAMAAATAGSSPSGVALFLIMLAVSVGSGLLLDWVERLLGWTPTNQVDWERVVLQMEELQRQQLTLAELHERALARERARLRADREPAGPLAPPPDPATSRPALVLPSGSDDAKEMVAAYAKLRPEEASAVAPTLVFDDAKAPDDLTAGFLAAALDALGYWPDGADADDEEQLLLAIRLYRARSPAAHHLDPGDAVDEPFLKALHASLNDHFDIDR